MASIIRIKRSTVAGNPATLATGELAYSALAEDGSPTGGDRLYIGMGVETSGNAANHIVIGGKYFTDMMDHTRGTLTANSAILTDTNNKIDQIKVGNMTFTGSTNTVVTADTNGNLNLTPNGTGSIVASKLYVTGTTTFNNNVTPTGNGTVNLGTSSNRFGTIYLSGTTIELGTQSLTSNAGGVQLTGNLTTSTLTANIADGTAPFVITSTTRVANLNVATAGNLITGTSNVIVTSSGNVTVGVAGNVAIFTVTGTGANISGTANISGNANIGNIGTDTIIATTGNITTINSGLVQNGNSNVTITANANVTITSRSNATLVISNIGANISGYLDVSGNISNANVILANTFTSNIAIGTAPFTVTSTTRVSNLNVANAGYADSAGTAGTVTTAAQSNITSVGTLTSLTVSGQSNLNALSNVKITGGSAGQFIKTDGAGNLSFDSFTVEAGSSIVNGNSNVVVAANSNVSISVRSTSNVVVVSNLGANISGYLDVSGNISNANVILANIFTSNISIGTAPFTVTSTTQVANLNVATAGSIVNGNSNVTIVTNSDVSVAANGAVRMTVAANGNVGIANIAPAHTLSVTGTMNISGNANIGNLGTAQVLASANITSPQLISNIAIGTAPLVVTSTTQVANLNVATAGSSTTAGTVTDSSQSNITSLGTLTGLSVNATITANTFTSNIAIGTAPFVVTSTTQVANLNVALAGNAVNLNNGTSNVVVTSSGNITVGSAGNAAVFTITGTGANISGTANISGNLYVGNILTNGYYFANGAAFSVDTTQIVNGNSNVKVEANSNVGISVRGVSNVVVVSNLGANINGYANISGNANVGNLGTGTIISTTASVGSLYISGFEISSTSTNQNISLNPNGTGNIDVNSSYITNLSEPYNDSDAATKLYVDTVAQGLHIHAPAQVATTTNLAAITGDTVTYNNGTDGVGATLTLGTAITTIDGVTYPTVNVFVTGSRIVVKDEATAAHNGIYTINAAGTVLTRANDFNSTAEIKGGDFVFVERGTLYKSTGWVSNQITVTMGTSDIDFLQFAGAGTYTAGTGLELNGSEFKIATNYVGQSSITTVGNVTSGGWRADVITYQYGGTGQSSYAKGDIVYASAANVLSKLTVGTNGQVLQLSDGLPIYGDLDGGTYA